MKPSILLIEDELSIAQNLRYALEGDGFEVTTTTTGSEGLALADKIEFSLAIVDLGLPDQSGFEVGRVLIGKSQLPVIFLTARGAEIDRVAGLELGADDYLVKPVSLRELCARVRAVLRRVTANKRVPQESISTSGLTVDESRKRISYRTTDLELSKTEYQLLLALLRNTGRVLSREQLMNLAWDDPNMSLDRTVDAHIKTLRNKLERVAPGEEFIITHRGFGYSFRE